MANIKLKRKQKKDKSNKWLERHLNDYFFIQAKKKGLRSRSSFKLMQINQKFNFFFKGASVLDLGAAPGGWSQISKKLVGRKGKVLGIDKISIEPINDIKFLKIDINDLDLQVTEFFNQKVDILLSDMAPNTSGHKLTDHLKIIELVETAINCSDKFLKTDGFFVCKIFQGGAQGKLLELMKTSLKKIKYIKPLASRKESSEVYLFGIKK